MLELKLNDKETIKFKEGLSEVEYITIIEYTIDAYRDGLGEQKDLFGVVPYNPIKAQQAFYRALCEICIENYDSNKYAKYFEANVPTILVKNVKNALEAQNTVNEIIHNSMSLSVTINNFLSGVLNMLDGKLPTGDDLAKSLKKLPKEFNKMLETYSTIKNASKKEFDGQLNNGEYKELENK